MSGRKLSKQYCFIGGTPKQNYFAYYVMKATRNACDGWGIKNNEIKKYELKLSLSDLKKVMDLSKLRYPVDYFHTNEPWNGHGGWAVSCLLAWNGKTDIKLLEYVLQQEEYDYEEYKIDALVSIWYYYNTYCILLIEKLDNKLLIKVFKRIIDRSSFYTRISKEYDLLIKYLIV